MNDDSDVPFSEPDTDGEIDEQEQYDEGLDDELDEDEMDDDGDANIPDGFHLE